MATYKIIRLFQSERVPRRTVKRGLTLEQAKAHCRSPETSSRTATTAEAEECTRVYGPWFDGYDVEEEGR